MSRAYLLASRTFVIAAVVMLGAAGCGNDAASRVASPATELLPLPVPGAPEGATLLECDPPDSAQTTTGVIGPLGGTLALGGTRVVIPPNAVVSLTSFRLTIPASRLVEIVVRAGDAEHFLFGQPVLVTIDYGRCADRLPLRAPLSVWHIDETSKSLLENMPAVDLRPLHTIGFYTGHLSGYAVAD